MPEMELLHLHSNALTGSLPAELASLTWLAVFSCEDNIGLTGPIPNAFGNLTNYNDTRGLAFSMNISGTQLSGVVPECLCTLSEGDLYTEGERSLTFDCSDMLCGCDCSCSNQSILQ